MWRKMMFLPVLAISGMTFGAETSSGLPPQTTTTAKFVDLHLQTHIAGSLILGNQEEIALCQFALTRTQDAKVKGLIQKMIEDHTQFLGKLKKFAPQAATRQFRQRVEGGTDARASASREILAVQLISQKDAPAGAAAPEAVNSSTAIPATPGQSFGERLFAVEYESAQECLALNQKLLEKYKGSSFDQAFLGQQIGMHVGMLARLQGAAKFSTGEFQELLKKGQETTKHHMHHAEQLMEELSRGPIEKSHSAPRS